MQFRPGRFVKNGSIRPRSIRYQTLFAAFIFSSTSCFAQSPMGAQAGGSGPIDIQANEQEFAGDHVIARGNVRVTYKDCIVISPIATLYRDAGGSPQKAVFTGHPHLIQGLNKIDAETLVFEMSSGRVVADGNAHSEVISMENPDEQPAGLDGSTPAAKAAKPAAKDGKGKAATASKKSKDDATQIASADESASTGADSATTGDATADASAADTAEKKPAAAKGKKPAPPKVTEKIITDADHQEYERNTGRFSAAGHVRVKHGDISVRSDRLNLVYGADSRPETAVFTGNVLATQFDNCTQADTMTYFLSTQRLQATGNVRSKVIQQKADGPKKGGLLPGIPSKEDKPAVCEQTDSGPDDPIYITSDAQDYSKDSGRMTAEGNVRVFYGEATGAGPKVILLRNEDGQAQKILFTGRSQISQPGKRWIGDKITFTVADKKVLAEGNTKAIILQSPNKGRPTQTAPVVEPSKLAGRAPAVSEKPAAVAKNDGTKM
jgi:lipopolysaccharide export system protein LptA